MKQKKQSNRTKSEWKE